MSALQGQVGGVHYTKLKIQPVEVAYEIGASPLWLKVSKYLTRDKVDQQEDFRKAIHCIHLENELMELRCRNYVVAAVRYDHPAIRAFSDQFEDADLINSVLQDMFFGYFQSAVGDLQNYLVEFEKEGGQ